MCFLHSFRFTAPRTISSQSNFEILKVSKNEMFLTYKSVPVTNPVQGLRTFQVNLRTKPNFFNFTVVPTTALLVHTQ